VLIPLKHLASGGPIALDAHFAARVRDAVDCAPPVVTGRALAATCRRVSGLAVRTTQAASAA
jgi:hypothetical protein